MIIPKHNSKHNRRNIPFCKWMQDYQNKMGGNPQASHTLLHLKTTCMGVASNVKRIYNARTH